MTGLDLADSIGRASRWIEASGIPVHPAEKVRAWLDGLGVAPPVGIQQLMTAIRVGVVAAGDAGYAAGRAQADDLAEMSVRANVEQVEAIRHHAQGYADAVAHLRDDARYLDWWLSSGVQPDGPVRQHLADYLEAVGPDGPDVTAPPRAQEPALALLLAAIDNAVRNGSYMTGANLALDLLCDRLGVDRDRLKFRPDWRRTAEREG